MLEFQRIVRTIRGMAEHVAQVSWRRLPDEPFIDNRYLRKHVWKFDGGTEIPASSTPSVVPVPMSVEDAVDPEEAFVASLSSCHMLWFLALAAKKRFVIDEYVDDATGYMGRNEAGKPAILKVVLRPRVLFGGENRPDTATHDAIHHAAHEQCFIANSVTSEVVCEPVIA